MEPINLENIDNLMKASDIVMMLENRKSNLETKYKTLIRVDGVPKRGKSAAVNAVSQQLDAIRMVMEWTKQELVNRQMWDERMKRYASENEEEWK